MSRQDSSSKKKMKYCDYSLFFLIIFLICFGLVMLYSTSAYNAMAKYGDPLYYLKRQMFAACLGIAAMTIISRIDYHIWSNFSLLAYLLALFLCTIVIFTGRESHGQARWLELGPLSFQPSELAKLAIIIFLSDLVSRIPKQIAKMKNMMIIMGVTVVPLAGAVAVNNLSTAVIIVGIAIVIVFVASPKYLQFLILGGLAVLAGAVLMFASFSYRRDRFDIWLHPENYEKGYQTLQGLYAIGSGGLFGKGLGQSMQKLGFVPEAQNDMIFSIVCEELGLFGAICVISLFLLVLWRFMIIANNSADLYGALIVAGIMAHVAIQVVLNIAVVTNTIPNTGVTLPFISYGGTSTSFLLAEMGLALSVSRGIRLEGNDRG